MSPDSNGENNPEIQACRLLGASDKWCLHYLILQGLPLSAIDNAASSGVSATDLGIINQRTLKRRSAQFKTLTSIEGDRLYRACVVMLFAISIVGNRQTAIRYLLKPRKTLGGRTAFEITTTTPGYQTVKIMLERLQTRLCRLK